MRVASPLLAPCVFVLLLGLAARSGAQHSLEEGGACMLTDDECLSEEGRAAGTQCALQAVQLRGQRLAAAKQELGRPEHNKTELDHNLTEPNKTEHNLTEPNTTEQNLTESNKTEHRHKHKHHKIEQEPLEPQAPLPKAPKIGSTDPVVIKGNFLYNSVTGKRFFAKGVAYNPRNVKYDTTRMKKGNCTPGEPMLPKLGYDDDPTTEEQEPLWREALNAIANMGANTVRLYNVNPEFSHTKFMNAAAELGLYVIVPLTRHDWGYLPAFPSPLCFTENITNYGNVGTNLLTSAKLIVKEFSQYNNTLMLTVANELTIEGKNGYAAFPCVKGLTRDIHQYQAQCSTTMRRVPLIYADMDVGPPFRHIIGRYMACELESEDDVVDAYGINVYSYCDKEYLDDMDEDNFDYSPYAHIRKEFQTFGKPLLFTEFGCNHGEFYTQCPYRGGRTWPDVKTFFDELGEILSGAIAFEFSMEYNEYGLALTPGYTSDKNNKDSIYFLDNYFALQEQFSLHNVSTKWDGCETASCSWTPSKAHKMEHKHHRKHKCPSEKWVKMLFKDKNVGIRPNWDVLPPTPIGADQKDLAECPKYEVTRVLYEEACCHMNCST